LPGEDGVLRAASSVAPVRLDHSKLVLVACWESLQPVWWLCGCFGLQWRTPGWSIGAMRPILRA